MILSKSGHSSAVNRSPSKSSAARRRASRSSSLVARLRAVLLYRTPAVNFVEPFKFVPWAVNLGPFLDCSWRCTPVLTMASSILGTPQEATK